MITHLRLLVVFTLLAAFALLASAQPPDAARAKAIVERERQAFGPMAAAEVAVFLKQVARALNAEPLADRPFGVLVKTTGAHCAGYSCDIICTGQGSAQRQWDVLEDADPGGAQKPGWDGPLPTIVVRACEIQDGDIIDPPPPPPPDCPTCPVCPTCPPDLSDDVHRLIVERDIARAQRDLVQQDLDALQRRWNVTRCEIRPGWAGRLGIGCRLVFPE